ncbi:patatin-like phospholipase family protein [Marmoricola sp. RAF53]|uniref:patatin-like phospholipase family protein n=1 Tax=Marmoricola sp. RAF53 TaxID=3233059 RepID=UPI003F96D442
MTRALVLGGGGVTGVAWEIGVLEGLRRAGVDLTGADTILGTSAGAAVGARITTGDLAASYEAQTTPAVHEMSASLGPTTLLRLGIMLARRGEQSAKWRKVGAAALAAHPESPEARREVMRSRIGDPAWPDRDLRITAVDVDAGELVVFDASSGVALIDAVAASCAVPLVWPPVPIDGTTYVDGGIRSPTNADLVAGAERLVVLAPQTQAVSREHAIARQVERTGAAHHVVVAPDGKSERAMGSNALDPTRREAAAAAGLRQGQAMAEKVAAVWG